MSAEDDSNAARHPVLDEIDEALDAVTRAEEEVGRRKLVLSERVRQICRLEDRHERLRLVRHLYWHEERIKVSDLIIALFGSWDETGQRIIGDVDALSSRFADRMRKMCGPIGWVDCATRGCSGKAPITSRSALRRYQLYNERDYCANCAPCPRRPVPGPNWREIVPTREQEELRWAELEGRRQRERERKRQELSALKQATGLQPDQLARLYELLSWEDDERRFSGEVNSS